MSLFTTGMNIAAGKKHDASKVSENVVTKAEITKKNVKLAQLFDKFDADKNGTLDTFEQAKMMDYFKSIESNGNGKVSKKELNAAAKELGIKGGDLKEFFKNFFNAIKNEQKVDGQEVKDFENNIESAKQIAESKNSLIKELDVEIAELEKIVQDTKDAEASRTPEETKSGLHSGKKMSVTNPNNPNGTIEGEMTVTATDKNGMPTSFTVKNEKTGNVFTYEYDKESGCYVNKKENKYYTLDENNNLVRDNSRRVGTNIVSAASEAKKAGYVETDASTSSGIYKDEAGKLYKWSQKDSSFKEILGEEVFKDGTTVEITDDKSKINRKYNENGQIDKKTTFDKDGNLVETTVWMYDENGTKTRAYTEKADGTIIDYQNYNPETGKFKNVKTIKSHIAKEKEAQEATQRENKIKEMNEWILIKNLGDGFTIRKEPGIFKMNPKCKYFDKDGNTYTKAEYDAIKNKK